MARKSLLGIVVAASLLLTASMVMGAEPAGYFSAVKGRVLVDGKAAGEGRVFANAEKTRFLVCIPGDYVYKVDREGRKVSALRRSSVMVKPDKCRPVEGAREQPIEGHLYVETKAGFSFNDLAGHKVSVELPPGTLR